MLFLRSRAVGCVALLMLLAMAVAVDVDEGGCFEDLEIGERWGGRGPRIWFWGRRGGGLGLYGGKGKRKEVEERDGGRGGGWVGVEIEGG